jgi:hypothetical protein
VIRTIIVLFWFVSLSIGETTDSPLLGDLQAALTEMAKQKNDAFLIVENKSEQCVQFTTDPDAVGILILDIPIQQFNPDELKLAVPILDKNKIDITTTEYTDPNTGKEFSDQSFQCKFPIADIKTISALCLDLQKSLFKSDVNDLKIIRGWE